MPRVLNEQLGEWDFDVTIIPKLICLQSQMLRASSKQSVGRQRRPSEKVSWIISRFDTQLIVDHTWRLVCKLSAINICLLLRNVILCCLFFFLSSFLLSQSYRQTVVQIKAAEMACHHSEQEENDFIDIWLKRKWSKTAQIYFVDYANKITFGEFSLLNTWTTNNSHTIYAAK